MNPRKTGLILVLIVILGAALRIRSLWFQIPDWDERWTLHVASMPWLEVIRFSIMVDFNPPLFYIAAKAFVSIGGAHLFMVRLPSLVAGVLMVPVAYLIGEELEDDVMGLIMAFFTATLYSVIYYTQYARSFALAGLFFAVAIWAFLMVFHGEDRQWLFIGAGLAAIYTHAFAVVPFCLMGAYLWWRGRIGLKHAAGAALAAVPFAVMMWTIAQYRHANYGLTPQWVAGTLPLEMLGYAFPFILILIIISWVKDRNGVTGIFLAVPVVTGLSAVAVSFWTPVFPRYALATMPMLLAVAMVPMSRWVRSREPWWWYFGFPILLLNVLQLWSLWTVQMHPTV